MAKKPVVLGADGYPVMSRSELETAACGFRHHRVYVEQMNDDSEFSLRGTGYHGVKKTYVKMLHAAKVPADFEIANEAFQEGVRLHPVPVDLIPEIRDIYDRHVQHFELDLNAYAGNEDLRVRADAPVPYQLETDLDYVHADRSEVEILDDKTYYVDFSEAQARELVQTRYYMWAAMQEYPGFEWYRMSYVFVRLNRITSVRFNRAEFDQLDQEIRAMDTVRRGLYDLRTMPDATPGEVCGFCSFDCPVKDDPKRALMRVKTQEDFVRLAGYKIVAEKIQREIQKSLKQYAALHGPQNVNGEVFGFRDKVSKRYNAEGLVKVFQENNIPVTFDVTASAIKNVLKAFPEVVPEVELLEQLSKKPSFGHRSVKADLMHAPELEDGEE